MRPTKVSCIEFEHENHSDETHTYPPPGCCHLTSHCPHCLLAFLCDTESRSAVATRCPDNVLAEDTCGDVPVLKIAAFPPFGQEEAHKVGIKVKGDHDSGEVDVCLPNQHGPACISNSDCCGHAGCLRCARSGYCTAVPGGHRDAGCNRDNQKASRGLFGGNNKQ